MFTRPLRLRGREWALPAVLAGGAGLLYVWRDEIRSEVQEHRTRSRDEFFQDARLTGKGVFVPALASVLAALGAARDSSREKQTALLLAESFAASAVYSAIGSFVLAAERPQEGESVRFLDTQGHGVSLDAALSASMIAPLERAYLRPRPGERPAARFWRRSGRALLYLAPALVAYQRLNQDKHWAPDAALGYATGLLSGRVLCSGYERPGGPRAHLSAGGLRVRF